MAVSATKLIASFITSGRLYGVGIGSTLMDLQQKINGDFVDVVDGEGDSMRRDYGFIEFYLNLDQNWSVSGGAIELHRLAARNDMANRWHIAMRDKFPQYLTWDDLRDELSKLPNPPALQIIDQGDFLEYRASATKVSVLVNNDHEERDEWLGHGDVWSVSLG
ncbi:hypothetical protein ACFYYY_12625 [Streptomyces sp. NPDC001834]|uniref:hypothetical protein n=1 Tax=Streptomyces sp. NPDC001834 TaxID=3364616 RepID=UPI003683B4BD